MALGHSKADNATALVAMRNAALMPLQIVKNRFYTFLEDTARIWADFWITYYGKRNLKQKDKSGVKYIPFDAERYKSLVFCANVKVINSAKTTDTERAQMLITLFEKGVINREQLLTRLPDGMVEDIDGLIMEKAEED